MTALLSVCLALAGSLGIRVEGPGYLRMVRNGLIVYAKQAQATVRGGWLAEEGGALFFPRLSATEGEPLEIQPDGWVLQGSRRIGRLTLALFEDGREPKGAGYLTAEGRPTLVHPGDPRAGRILASRSVQPHATRAGQETAEEPRIVFRARSEVATDLVRLGDVAEVTADPATKARADAIELGRAPLPGSTAVLTRAQVLAALRGAGLQPDDWRLEMPARVEVSRSFQVVRHEQLVAAAVEAAKPAVGPGVELMCPERATDVRAPAGRLELKAERVTTSPEGASVVVGWFVEGSRHGGRTVRLVATAPGGGPLARAAAGATVRLRVWSGAACLELPARLQESARVGQTVRVITEARTVHSGVLVDPNTVEVRL
ncbi:MAG: hypothetical protein N2109_10615 [Fimbriimonadales bacterium]|nr:hypothetical protein [Fimbriimonadales bacterium]